MSSTQSTQADVLLSPTPSDSVAELRWSPSANYLASSSWDSTLRIYDIQTTGMRPSGSGIHAQAHPAPILSCDWSKDGTLIATGTGDNKAYLLDLNAPGPTPIQVAAHEAPVKGVRFVTVAGSNGPILATGSWDSTIKFWDLRQNTPLASLTCDGKVYSMDAAESLLCVATSHGSIQLVDLNNPTSFKSTKVSQLKHQIRVVSCLAKGDGYATGSVEGRCAFKFLDPSRASEDFTFKCHRFDDPSTTTTSKPAYASRYRSVPSDVNVFAVNAVSIHPRYCTFSTAGADGGFAFWDSSARSRLASFPCSPARITDVVGNGNLITTSGGNGGRTIAGKTEGSVKEGTAAITATTFNSDGSLFAYAVGYDWSKGHLGSNAEREDRIMLHVVGDECSPRVKAAAKR